ncbi:pantoate--beta-alanine ligase [Methylomarinovum caldicuralii]|uniref:Pantothenate synthetase n=1 Tax=Methylomarinovum caldicuralii TaxID=438856 RepID=A0AAU9CR58_9GAMM|nr:pantoate--beta-alanine ligase [Methylomarinovum caldicuralii]BCX82448.1 pantoate--beta-alanine ligase [Methylomarinovum caldicuralii]
MRRFDRIADLRACLEEWRRAGQRIVLVPTMGNLHEGHLQLVDTARRCSDRVVVSIFVNPLQFGPGEDYDRYPRTLEADCAKLETRGADLVFAPPVAEIYPRPLAESTFVEVPGITEILCGASRPGHFRGVATVVAKLFNIVQPDVAVFGEKDYQQLQVIRRLVADLNFPVEIVGVPIVREADGLALSSRNGYLTPEERARAPLLYRSLCQARDAIAAGERDFAALCRRQRESLEEAGFRPDYFEIRRPDLGEAGPDDRPLMILAAAWLGRTRLIDNLQVP